MTEHRQHPHVSELQLGEDPDSRYPGDAHHWLGIYSELLRLVDEAVFDLGNEHALSEAELDLYRGVFQRRLKFWQEKARDHEAPAVAGRQAGRPPED